MTGQLNVAVGAWIRELRELKGMSQTKMARAVGVQQSTYSRLEDGMFPWTVARLSLCAIALDTKASQILASAERIVG